MGNLLARARVLSSPCGGMAPAAKSGSISNMICHRCNSKSHIAKDCQKCGTRFLCSKIGHWARDCLGNETGQGISASHLPHEDVNAALPAASIYVDREKCSALIDSGCSQTIIDADQYRPWRRADVDVMSRPCCSDWMVIVSTEEGSSAKISMLVVRGKPLGFDLLLGIDAIKTLRGMVVGPTGSVQLGNKKIVKCAAISINESDFTATFKHWSWAWTVAWKWSEGHAPEALDNSMVLDAPDIVMRRAVFSLCGRLVGHFPVCGWLCVACGVLKRRASLVAKGSDDEARNNLLQHMISETVDCVARRSSPWRLVCRWMVTERVGRCQLLSNQNSIGETRNSAWGCLLAATWKRRPTY